MGNFTAVPDVVVNQSFPPSLWESAIMNNLNLGVFRQLASTKVTGASVANITFASIEADFLHLLLVVHARDTGAGTTFDSLLLQYNGDTGANYDSTTGGTGQTTMTIGYVMPGGGSANRFGATIFLVPNYADTTMQKLTLAPYSALEHGGTFEGAPFSGRWNNVNAINQILLKSSSGNLDIGTVATIYGLPA